MHWLLIVYPWCYINYIIHDIYYQVLILFSIINFIDDEFIRKFICTIIRTTMNINEPKIILEISCQGVSQVNFWPVILTFIKKRISFIYYYYTSFA